MTLECLGWSDFFRQGFESKALEAGLVPARISRNSKHVYHIFCAEGKFVARVSGSFRHRANESSDYPAVGDWVAVRISPDGLEAELRELLPRETVFSRQGVSASGTESKSFQQVVACNVNVALIVSALDGSRGFNKRRLERYLTLTRQSGAKPVIILNKIDLPSAEPEVVKDQIIELLDCKEEEIIAASAKTGVGIKEILESHKGPFTGAGHAGLYEILTTSWHAQLAINLAMMGSLSIIVAHHMYAMPPYPYIATDYATQLSLFTHHMWIGGFCVVGGAAHAAIFMVRDYTPANNYNNLLDRVLRHRDAIISHLNWVCIFLGCHAFGFYVHNDTMRALGRPQDVFSDKAIQLQPIFAQWIQNIHLLAPGTTAPNALATTSYAFGGEVVEVGGKIAMMPIKLGTADFMVHHIHAFTIHVTVLILLKGVLYARSSKLIPDKANLGFRFPCDGPGRGGTCQSSSWDHVFLGLFWMYNSISVVIFHFSWKMQSDVWGTISPDGTISHVTGGNFAKSAVTINGWLRDFLWSQASQVIQSYGSASSAYGLIFLGAHFIWAFSLMFLFSGRGYWQELIESIVWAHNKLNFAPTIQPRALSITQGRAVGLAHYLLGGIGTTWAFFLARAISIT